MNEKLEKEIAEARDHILGLEDNWDDEGAKGYKAETFDRIVAFLRILVNEYPEMEIPALGPARNGGIDIHWRTPNYELLIGVNEDGDICGFYGDNYGHLKINGEGQLTQALAIKIKKFFEMCIAEKKQKEMN